MKHIKIFSLLLALLMLLSACAPAQQDHSNIIHLLPQSHEGQCPDADPYTALNKESFYANYRPACCLTNAKYRSLHGLLSGVREVPGQFAQEAENRPMAEGKFVRNTSAYYLDGGSTYVVTDENGKEILRIFKGGAYITLEEIAAYVFAFGSVPANYDADKDAEPRGSAWGEYLRVNHTFFSGNTSRYPYEPMLPNISGRGGTLRYMELDIGTTGTDCDPQYPVAIYNNGNRITRGAARIVYGKNDLNGNGIYERGELHVFYTYNHYNDFREYLNYYGGWGEMFGNITGGGSISSKYDYNPTDYVEVAFGSLSQSDHAASVIFVLPPSLLRRRDAA